MMRVCTGCGQEPAGDGAEETTCPNCGAEFVPMGADLALGPGRILGQDRYVVLELLGEGAMGAVYLAKHRSLAKRVAIKVMTGFDRIEGAVTRFNKEAQNAARLQHPHNVKVFDFGQDEDGTVFLAMELVNGRPLTRLPYPLAPPRALKIAAQICRALSEAHDLGLVHRDLKPDNVMVTDLDGEDFARVLDYGIAKSLGGSGTVLTRTGMMIGTPRYISPEQALGRPVDPRSDIYGLGAMLFEMLTGRVPFEAPNPIALAVAHVHRQPPRPSDLAPVPPHLDELVLRMLAKDPDQRPASMREVREEIIAILESREPGAGPAPSLRPPRPGRAVPSGDATRVGMEPSGDETRVGTAPSSVPPRVGAEDETLAAGVEELTKKPTRAPAQAVIDGAGPGGPARAAVVPPRGAPARRPAAPPFARRLAMLPRALRWGLGVVTLAGIATLVALAAEGPRTSEGEPAGQLRSWQYGPWWTPTGTNWSEGEATSSQPAVSPFQRLSASSDEEAGARSQPEGQQSETSSGEPMWQRDTSSSGGAEDEEESDRGHAGGAFRELGRGIRSIFR